MFDVVNKINFSDLIKALNAKDLEFSQDNVYNFNYLRSAIDFLFKYGNFPKKKILFPAFICPVVIEIALRNNIQPVLIDANLDDFNLDVSNLSNIDLNEFDAIFVYHVFGNIVDIDALKKKFKGIKIIEDSATSLQIMPSTGKADYTFFSHYKYLANLRGGSLYTKDNKLKDKYLGLPKDQIGLKDFLDFLIHINGFHQVFSNFLRGKSLQEIEPMSSLKWQISQESEITQKIFSFQSKNLSQEIEARQKLAKFYQEQVNEKFFIYQKIKTESCYFNFSLALKPEFVQYRDLLLRKLREKNIFADRMYCDAPCVLPDYEKYCLGECKTAKYLAKAVINLPIRGEYSESNVKELFLQLNAICEELLGKLLIINFKLKC